MRPRRTGRVRGRNRRLPRAGLPHLFAVILAGGRGERFWPLSTAARPKQFLPFRSGRSLLEATFSRLAAHLPPDRILVVTAETHAVEVRRLLPDLQPSNLLLEPTGRDTAPALALAA
ncbi:MAG: sugar phosphate nucleotidyltransferase, partial [Candidatus Methylomirabilales bacterium]